MVIKYFEEVNSNFEGTIIDLETVGNFDLEYEDSRRYKSIIPVIFGCIDKKGIQIYCAKNKNSISKFKEKILKKIALLERPFYAFNTEFERAVLFNYLHEKIEFECELNAKRFESKKSAVKLLNISDYSDPFNDNGLLCSICWLNGKFEDALMHNRSCLLKARDLLLKRGFREPDDLKFIK